MAADGREFYVDNAPSVEGWDVILSRVMLRSTITMFVDEEYYDFADIASQLCSLVVVTDGSWILTITPVLGK